MSMPMHAHKDKHTDARAHTQSLCEVTLLNPWPMHISSHHDGSSAKPDAALKQSSSPDEDFRTNSDTRTTEAAQQRGNGYLGSKINLHRLALVPPQQLRPVFAFEGSSWSLLSNRQSDETIDIVLISGTNIHLGWV